MPDWYEWHYHGGLSGDARSDLDGDGLTTADEIARHLQPRVFDAIHNHGIAMRLSAVVHADLQFFPCVRQVLEDGALQPFSSQDTVATGTFTMASNVHPAVGDWDGDGDLDFFVGGGGGQLRVFENTGSPVIMNLVERTAAFGGGAWGVIDNPASGLGDFNGDGLEDLAVGGNTNTVRVWSSPGVFAAPGTPAFSIQIAGTDRALPAFLGQDFLILKGDGLVSLYTNLPTAELSSADHLGIPVPDARAMSVSDVNEDNIPDVLISDQQGRIWEFHGQ